METNNKKLHYDYDSTLSTKAYGVLSKALKLSKTWSYNIKGIVSMFSDGERSIKGALKELQEKGYLKITKIPPCRENGGRWSYDYIFDKYSTKESTKKEKAAIVGIDNSLTNCTTQNPTDSIADPIVTVNSVSCFDEEDDIEVVESTPLEPQPLFNEPTEQPAHAVVAFDNDDNDTGGFTYGVNLFTDVTTEDEEIEEVPSVDPVLDKMLADVVGDFDMSVDIYKLPPDEYTEYTNKLISIRREQSRIKQEYYAK